MGRLTLPGDLEPRSNLPYAKRPYHAHHVPPETYALGTGDFEAVSYGRAADVRHARARQHERYDHPPGSQPAPQFVTGAPHSLSPMAMSSDPNGTGPQPASRNAKTVVIRSRPSMRAGMTILVGGTLIGAILGITTRPRAATAAELSAATPAVTSEATLTPTPAPDALPATPPVTSTVLGATPIDPSPTASASASTTTTTTTTPPKEKKHVAWTKPATRTADAEPHPEPKPAKAARAEKAEKPEKAEKAEKDDGWTVASADNSGAKPKKATKSEPEPKEAKADPKEAKADPKESKKSSGKAAASKPSDDAVNVLKAAMGATENTL